MASTPLPSSFNCKVWAFERRLKVSSTICLNRCGSGSGRSTYSTRLSNSGGMLMDGAVSMSVRRFVENFWPSPADAAPRPRSPYADENPSGGTQLRASLFPSWPGPAPDQECYKWQLCLIPVHQDQPLAEPH